MSDSPSAASRDQQRRAAATTGGAARPLISPGEFSDLARRSFLKWSGLAAGGLALGRLPLMAGPFTREDFGQCVPEDKKLAPGWVQSLFARGAPEVLRGADLRYVGMPVGGLCAGQLYLGGDGRLWRWDIFNRPAKTGSEHYAKPPEPDFPVAQGFTLRVGGRSVPLDQRGFADVSFRGEYPIGRVDYRDASVPVTVRLEAFSPFIPLNTDDSSLPATILQFSLTNITADPVHADLVGTLENAVLRHHRGEAGLRHNRVVARRDCTVLACSVEKSEVPAAPAQADIVFEEWKQETYAGWQVEGTAFGGGPVLKSAIPSYQGDVGGDTARVANSHASAPGRSTAERDDAVGRLISRPFTIERRFITFWIGGGNHPGRTCLNLVVDGKVELSATGQNNNRMAPAQLDVAHLLGRKAHLELVDAQKGGWGNLGVGRILFSDQPGTAAPAFTALPDLGTMTLTLLGAPAEVSSGDATRPIRETLIGELGRTLRLEAGGTAVVTFVLTWHFPNLTVAGIRPSETGAAPPGANPGRHYATRLADATAVAAYVVQNFERLAAHTRRWREVWYDSTLPYWFLDRTQLNTSILATSTCHRFASGRFWAWEGVGCCAGTCSHVWHYAHAMARQFPDLERILRERTDFGVAMQPDGAIHFRGENNKIPAIDGQAGSILRTLREHQMSADDAFLRRVWPAVKRATDWLMAKDADGDGIIQGNQHNTLDADWFGPVAWLSGLSLAALAAAAVMADEMGDPAYAARCRDLVARGQARLVADLFDGDYFINRVDPQHLDTINSGTGCEIDQVMGQSWAFQVGLPRVLPERETCAALRALWKYNFTPDVGPYRQRYPAGRWYAMAGEAGLLMCTFPRRDWDFEQASGRGKGRTNFAGYFNECMNGFEYQVAGHMLWENLTLEGLAITRAVHDRYQAAKRNPWNEVECGDHYARSMASYGVFLAACGFEYHGPRGRIGFAPRLTPEDFRCPFTAAEGWGTFSQKVEGGRLRSDLAVQWGQLRLKTIALQAPAGVTGTRVRVTVAGRDWPAQVGLAGRRAEVALENEVVLQAGQTLHLELA